MIATITGALQSVVFRLALGYGAGRAHAFPKDGVSAITTLVLDFALPASLLISTVAVSREALFAEGPLFLAFFLVVAATWVVVFLLGRVLFHHDVQEAGLQALLISLAAVPFYGIAVTSSLFGKSAGIVASIGSIIVNLVAIPATTVALSLGTNKGSARTRTSHVGPSFAHSLAAALLEAAKTPYIAASRGAGPCRNPRGCTSYGAAAVFAQLAKNVVLSTADQLCLEAVKARSAQRALVVNAIV